MSPPMRSETLLRPLSFRCGAVARNRIALAPLTNQQSHADGTLGEDELRWLERRAAGGFGLVETCAAHVRADGQGFPGQLGIFGDQHLPGLERLAGAIAERGALGVVQLYHGGARSPAALIGAEPWSASAIAEARPGFEPARAASEAELGQVIDDFAAAARRAARAGFAGVELHGAHGYLFTQFLSRELNRREDRWGGDLPGRARLLREATQAVRAAVPSGFIVGARLSPEDFAFVRGLDLDESLEVAAWLAADGVDFVHLSLWDATRMTTKRPEEHPLPLFRARLPEAVRLIAAGAIWTVDDAERALARGADMVALGKAAILNPDWPREAAEDPGFTPERGPMSPDELAARAVSPVFVDYLRRFRGLVAET